MDQKTFMQKLFEELKKIMEPMGYDLSRESKVKNADQKVYGITVREHGAKFAITIYMEEFYACYSDGKRSFDQIVNDFIGYATTKYHDAKDSIAGLAETVRDFDRLADKVFIKMMDPDISREHLAENPDGIYIPFCGLLGAYRVGVGENEDGFQSFLVTRDMLNNWDITEEQLKDAAFANMERDAFLLNIYEIDPTSMDFEDNLTNYLYSDVRPSFDVPEYLKGEVEGPVKPMMALTNEQKLNGASMMRQ